ncbi:MAG: ABC transporter permease, partial [Xanthomonadaceae bacterium]|nr:ABC transporter permease [Xanthomonadaceae bacterium]
MRLHWLELILFSTYAELRAERARSYLGFLWWIIEPAMNMATYYLVFAIVLKTGQRDYVPFLLVGLTLWQWFKSGVSHGGQSIWQQLGLIRQVRLPLQVFPSVQILADTVKFAFILGLLLVILWAYGYRPNVTYFALIPVLLVELVFTAAVAYLVAAAMPFVPDLRFVIEQVLQVVMFFSGVVFSLDSIPPGLRRWFELNPLVELIGAGRDILMHARWPIWIALGRVAVISLALFALGTYLIQRNSPRYVKLPTRATPSTNCAMSASRSMRNFAWVRRD